MVILHCCRDYKYNTPVKPKAVVSFFGPTDLTALFNTNILAALILAQVVGTLPAANATLYQQSSPSTFVTTSTPPTLLLHAGADPLVPPAQATLLQTLLNNAGVTNQYVFYPSEGHGWTGANLDDSFVKIAAFLNAHVN
ncbi:MAG: prolyl oligopeptidase family serine peptidase [Chitinophagaceae bacterium]